MANTITTNQDIRASNIYDILKAIFYNPDISRSSLSRKLDLSKSVTTEIINELLDKKVIIESGLGEPIYARYGRKPIMLRINKDFMHFVAIDMNQEQAQLVLTNLEGSILRKHTVFIGNFESYHKRLNKLIMAIRSILNGEKIHSIAISSPGIFRGRDDFYINEQFKHWQINQLIMDLQEHFETKVNVFNDVNAQLVGEAMFGLGRNHSDFVFISCGLGLGAALYLANDLYEGKNNSAGEIGDFIITSDGMRLEDKINLIALKNFIEEKAKTKFYVYEKSEDIINYLLKSENKDLYDEFLNYITPLLSTTINNILSLLDINLIILGGIYEPFYSDLIPLLKQNCKIDRFKNIDIKPTSLSSNTGIFGLLGISIKDYLKKVAFNEL